MSMRGIFYRCNLFGFGGPQTEGVRSYWTQELEPVGERELRSGEPVEMYVRIDRTQRSLPADPKIRFDILEQDYLLTGGLDDRVATVLGTGTPPPDEDFPKWERVTKKQGLRAGETVAQAVATFRAGLPESYANHILVLDAPDSEAPSTHILTWWTAQRVEDWANAELYFIVNVDGAFEDQSDAVSVSPERFIEPDALPDLTLPELEGVAWVAENAQPGELVEFEVESRGLQRGTHIGITIGNELGDVVADFDLPLTSRSPHIAHWRLPADPSGQYRIAAELAGRQVIARRPIAVERTLRFRIDANMGAGDNRSAPIKYRVLDREGNEVDRGETRPGRTVEVKGQADSGLQVELEGVDIVGVADLPKVPEPVLPRTIGRSFRIVELRKVGSDER